MSNKVALTLRRQHKAIANGAAEKEDGRYLQDTVYFKAGFLYATTGRTLVRRPVDHTGGDEAEFLIPQEFFRDLKIPKGRFASALVDLDKGTMEVDLPNGSIVRCDTEDHGSYPNVLSHVKERSTPTFRLNGRNLLRVLKALGPFDKKGPGSEIILEFTADGTNQASSGVQIHLADGSSALLMPVIVGPCNY